MARDLGRFVSGAQNTVDDFKSELLDSEEVKEVRRSVEELKDETHHSVEKLRNEAASSIEGEEQDSEPPSEAETHELSRGEGAAP
jgi:Sec-independent protein translocase protein TatA